MYFFIHIYYSSPAIKVADFFISRVRSDRIIDVFAAVSHDMNTRTSS